MQKTIIAPIIAMVAVLLQPLLHVTITGEVQNILVNGIFAIIMGYGMWKNHKKGDEK